MRVRLHGEAFTEALRKHVVAALTHEGIEVSVCGLCQADIPCMHAIPDPEDGV